MTPPAPPALTAAEMIEKQTRVAEFCLRSINEAAIRRDVEGNARAASAAVDARAVLAALAAPPPDAGEHERIGDTSPTYARVDGAGLAAALGAEPVAPPPDAAPTVRRNAEDTAWLIESYQGDRFVDIDIFDDGDVVVSRGGKHDLAQAWAAPPPLPARPTEPTP